MFFRRLRASEAFGKGSRGLFRFCYLRTQGMATNFQFWSASRLDQILMESEDLRRLRSLREVIHWKLSIFIRSFDFPSFALPLSFALPAVFPRASTGPLPDFLPDNPGL